MKIGRNDPCPCGSGKKYKKCCLNRMVASGPKMSVEFLQKEPTDFEYINFSAENISNVLRQHRANELLSTKRHPDHEK